MIPQVQVWTDGSSDWNTKEGGWSAVLQIEMPMQHPARIIGGYASGTTNNLMETRAVYEAIAILTQKCSLEIVTDSQYVIYGMRRILENRKLLEKNRALWENMNQIIKSGWNHDIKLTKIKGHEGEQMNEFCDRIAVYCRKNKRTLNLFYEDFQYPQIEEIMGHARAGSL